MCLPDKKSPADENQSQFISVRVKNSLRDLIFQFGKFCHDLATQGPYEIDQEPEKNCCHKNHILSTEIVAETRKWLYLTPKLSGWTRESNRL